MTQNSLNYKQNFDASYGEILTKKSQILADLWIKWDGKSDDSFTSAYHDFSIEDKQMFFGHLMDYYNTSYPPSNELSLQS